MRICVLIGTPLPTFRSDALIKQVNITRKCHRLKLLPTLEKIAPDHLTQVTAPIRQNYKQVSSKYLTIQIDLNVQRHNYCQVCC